jgi:hypothetical protein
MVTATQTTSDPQTVPTPAVNTGSNVEPVPLVIGVTGHRDLVPGEIPQIRQRVREFLTDLKNRYPALPLRVISALAEGGDRLIAEEALALDIPLIAALPMAPEAYRDDFATPSSAAQFEGLLGAAARVLELPRLAGTVAEDPGLASEQNRQRQYAQLGIFLCAHCHILLALWDGKASDQLGGTAQVVRFHQDDVMPGFTDDAPASRLGLADDESDLVYHIVCSRDRPHGEPEAGLKPLDAAWLTTDPDQPRSAGLPERYEQIFHRTEQFSRDGARFAGRIAAEQYPLLPDPPPADLPESLRAIDTVFVVADWLAIHYQKRFTAMMRATHVLAVLMGLTFIAYSDLPNQEYMIYAFLVFFAVGAALFLVAKRGDWHRKYLDYRALAEGLRVQFFWAAAGVETGKATKYTHDNFLQKQDVELGWIRNVMRVTGMGIDLDRGVHHAGLVFAIAEWIGAEDGGQLGYYARKAGERTRLYGITQNLALIGLSIGVLTAVILALFHNAMSDTWRDVLIVLMGSMPLIVAVRQAYSHKKADKELTKQYQFMHQIFVNARRRLDGATSDAERRKILKALGDAALDEHAEWILMHRERPLEHGRY